MTQAGRKYANGQKLEYKVRDHLETYGWHIIRAAGSKGKADLIGLRFGKCVLVQVKASSPLPPPAERKALHQLAYLTGTTPVVAYKPFRQPIEYRQLTGAGPKDFTEWNPE